MSNLAESYGNRKEEILERSRNASNDEGAENARLRGVDFGLIIATLAIGAPMFVLSIVTHHMIALASICALSGTASSGRNFVMYRFNRKKANLIWAIILGITGVTAFVMFILYAFGR
jgi:hypothetical protein